jgi:DNA-directed RNA polymerase subunit RPC12/RpoP
MKEYYEWLGKRIEIAADEEVQSIGASQDLTEFECPYCNSKQTWDEYIVNVHSAKRQATRNIYVCGDCADIGNILRKDNLNANL